MGKDIFFYSITLEPDKDTPAILAEYAKRFEVGKGWLFLTGEPQYVETLRRNLGFAYPDDPDVDADKTRHIGLMLMGYEPYDWWGTVAAKSVHPNEISKLFGWMTPGAQGAFTKNIRPEQATLGSLAGSR
jgi:protein SCO1/2